MTVNDLRGRLTLTVEEAGALVGLSRGAAYAAVRRDELPSLSLGRRIVVPTATLLRDVLNMPPDLVAQALGLTGEEVAP